MTKNIKEIKEMDREFDSHGPNEFNSSSLTSGSQMEQLRQEFAYLAGIPHVTVNVAITKIRKILAQHNIFIENDFPRFAEDEGEYFFQIYQHDSDIRTWEVGQDKEFPQYKEQDPLFLYVTFALNPVGFFNVHAEIMTEDELSDVIGDDEVEEF